MNNYKVEYDLVCQDWTLTDLTTDRWWYFDSKQEMEDYLDFLENETRIQSKTKGNKVSPQKRAEE